MMPEETEQTLQSVSEPHAGKAETPGVFVISCHKCTREYSLHGTESRLAICLLNEGWVKGDLGMICPHCPAATDAKYNKTQELERKARRVAA